MATYQDDTNPPEISRVLPSLDDLCNTPAPKSHMFREDPLHLTYDCPPHPLVHQSTPYVEPPRAPVLHSAPIIPITLTKFSGFAHEDGEKFLSDFKAIMTLQGITQDHPKVSAFSLYLAGPAFLWFDTLPVVTKSSWHRIEAEFKLKYVSFTLHMNGSLIADTEAFNSLKLKTTVLFPHTQTREKAPEVTAGFDDEVHRRASDAATIFCSGREAYQH